MTTIYAILGVSLSGWLAVQLTLVVPPITSSYDSFMLTFPADMVILQYFLAEMK